MLEIVLVAYLFMMSVVVVLIRKYCLFGQSYDLRDPVDAVCVTFCSLLWPITIPMYLLVQMVMFIGRFVKPKN
jgi:hypothetical protein